MIKYVIVKIFVTCKKGKMVHYFVNAIALKALDHLDADNCVARCDMKIIIYVINHVCYMQIISRKHCNKLYILCHTLLHV